MTDTDPEIELGAGEAIGELLAGFIQELREAGLPVSLTENLDAMQAVKHIPLEDREAFKYALAATLVKRLENGSDTERISAATSLVGARKVDPTLVTQVTKLLGSSASERVQQAIIVALGDVNDGSVATPRSSDIAVTGSPPPGVTTTVAFGMPAPV